MLLPVTGLIGGSEYIFQPGDIINTMEKPVTVALDAIYTYTGQELAQGDIFRTLMSAGRADIWCTAAQLIAALQGNLNSVSPPSNELYGMQPNRSVLLAWPSNLAPFQPGSSFRRTISATTAFALAMTVPANGGINAAAAPNSSITIAASSWREFILQINNSSPTQVIACNQTNASLLVTVPTQSLDFINQLTPGMSVYGTNIAANTVISAINRDTGVITLSIAATATIALNPITFTPTVTIYSLRSGTL